MAQASQRRAKEVMREEGKGEGKHLYKRFGGMTSNQDESNGMWYSDINWRCGEETMVGGTTTVGGGDERGQTMTMARGWIDR